MPRVSSERPGEGNGPGDDSAHGFLGCDPTGLACSWLGLLRDLRRYPCARMRTIGNIRLILTRISVIENGDGLRGQRSGIDSCAGSYTFCVHACGVLGRKGHTGLSLAPRRCTSRSCGQQDGQGNTRWHQPRPPCSWCTRKLTGHF